jgi:hypothetical protein
MQSRQLTCSEESTIRAFLYISVVAMDVRRLVVLVSLAKQYYMQLVNVLHDQGRRLEGLWRRSTHRLLMFRSRGNVSEIFV